MFCDFLLLNNQQIGRGGREFLIIKIQDGSVAGGKVLKQFLKVSFLSDDKREGINSSVIFELSNEPIHNGHKASSLGVEHASI